MGGVAEAMVSMLAVPCRTNALVLEGSGSFFHCRVDWAEQCRPTQRRIPVINFNRVKLVGSDIESYKTVF